MVKHDIHLEDRTDYGTAVLGEIVGGSSLMNGFPSLIVICLQGSIYTSPTLVWKIIWKLLGLIFLVDMNSPSFSSWPLCAEWWPLVLFYSIVLDCDSPLSSTSILYQLPCNCVRDIKMTMSPVTGIYLHNVQCLNSWMLTAPFQHMLL